MPDTVGMMRNSLHARACAFLSGVALGILAGTSEGQEQSVVDMKSPRPLFFGKDAQIRPVSAVVRQKSALVADADSGHVYLIELASGIVQRIPGVRSSRDTRISSGDAEEWHVLNPGARTLHRLSADGRLLGQARDDEFLRGATDLAYDLKRKQVLVSSRVVLTVDFTHKQTIGPWARYSANEIGDWVRIYGHALALAGDRLLVVDSSRDVTVVERGSSVMKQLSARGLTAATAVSGDRYGRAFIAQRNRIYIFTSSESAGFIDVAPFGLVEVTDLRVDGDLLTVTDSSAAKVVALELRPPR